VSADPLSSRGERRTVLAARGEAIRHAITTVTDHKPSDADIARVRARLAAGTA